jgi:hypothetical protein
VATLGALSETYMIPTELLIVEGAEGAPGVISAVGADAGILAVERWLCEVLPWR